MCFAVGSIRFDGDHNSIRTVTVFFKKKSNLLSAFERDLGFLIQGLKYLDINRRWWWAEYNFGSRRRIINLGFNLQELVLWGKSDWAHWNRTSISQTKITKIVVDILVGEECISFRNKCFPKATTVFYNSLLSIANIPWLPLSRDNLTFPLEDVCWMVFGKEEWFTAT